MTQTIDPEKRFIVAGASKSGSEWLLACLREHPQIFAAPASIDFFSRYYDKGLEWYEQHFADAQPGQLVGEKSTSYIIFPDVPERIAQWDPKVKLVFVLRDPISRAYSHYCMLLRAGQVSEKVEEVLKPGHMLVEEGNYYANIMRFLEKFDRDQIMVRLQDDLKADDAGFVRDVLSFLGADAEFRPSLLGKKLHVRKSRPKSLWLFNSAKGALNTVRRQGRWADKFVQWLRTSGAVDLFHRMNRGPSFPEFTAEHKRQLAEYHLPDAEKLSDWLGRDTTYWLKPYLETEPTDQKAAVQPA